VDLGHALVVPFRGRVRFEERHGDARYGDGGQGPRFLAGRTERAGDRQAGSNVGVDSAVMTKPY